MQAQPMGPDLVALLRAEENQSRLQQHDGSGARVRPSTLVTDRHNIPVTGTVKGPVDEFVAPSEDSPHPYPSLPRADQAEPRAESPPVVADASVEPAGDDDILDLDDDLFYQVIQAQVKGRAAPNGSCLAWYCNTTKNLSYKLHELRFSPAISKRKSTPCDSPHLQRAFICGWRMLSTTVIPLVPSHTTRNIWIMLHLLLFLVVLLWSIIIIVFSDSRCSRSRDRIQLTFAAVAAGASFLDLVVTCGPCILPERYAPRAPEAQPLLEGQSPRAQCKKFLFWISNHSDMARLVIIEFTVYVILVCSFPSTEQLFNNRPAANSDCSFVGLEVSAMIVISGIVLLVSVYMVQFLILLSILVRVIRHLWQPARRISFLVFFQLLLFSIGQRIIQVVMLYIIYTTGNQGLAVDASSLLGLVIVAYLLPTVGFLKFIALDYGWIEDLCIAFCGDYLGWLEHVSSTSEASQALKREVAGILQYFDYQMLRKDLDHGYCVRNFLYPFKSPLAMVYCIPYWVLVAIYLTGIMSLTRDCDLSQYDDFYIGSFCSVNVVVLPALLFFVNFHFLFVGLFFAFCSTVFYPCIGATNFYLYLRRRYM